jgi:nucleotide-binding universal stress UspA family protein
MFVAGARGTAMAFRDLLLGAITYPDQTPETALRSGVALARRIGGELTLATIETTFPILRNALANLAVGLDGLAKAAAHESAVNAAFEASCVERAGAEMGVTVRHIGVRTDYGEAASGLNSVARTRDLTLLPVGPATPGEDRALAESVLFESGRPVIVYPDEAEIGPAEAFGTVVIAWDGGAKAARAVADAMPLLRSAGAIVVFVAAHEKPTAESGIAAELLRHLAAHGLSATVDEREARGRAIGDVLGECVRANKADLLVMGGFGHHRLREFILGGATDSVLTAPPCPALLSH